MSEDLYETLGVDRKADGAAIKRAFKRAIGKVHPDHGTDTDAAQALTVAYNTLKDPQKKARYDATGEQSTAPFEDEVRDNTLSAIQFTLENAQFDAMDPLKATQTCVRQKISEVQAELDKARRRVARIKKANKVKSKEKGRNLFVMVATKRVAEIEQGIAKGEHVLRIQQGVAAVLEKYESGEIEPPASTFVFQTFVR